MSIDTTHQKVMHDRCAVLLGTLLQYARHPATPNAPHWVSIMVPDDFLPEAEQAIAEALTSAPPAQPQSEPSELLREAHGQIKHLIEDLTTTEDEGGLVRYVPKANLMFSNLIGALHALVPKMEAALAAQPSSEGEPCRG